MPIENHIPQISGELTSLGGIDGEISSSATLAGHLTTQGEISGAISVVRHVSGALATAADLAGALSIPEIVYPDIPIYDGGYEVTPLPFTETILETARKQMTSDVTVLEIPYYETSNESGGYTVIIG